MTGNKPLLYKPTPLKIQEKKKQAQEAVKNLLHTNPPVQQHCPGVVPGAFLSNNKFQLVHT